MISDNDDQVKVAVAAVKEFNRISSNLSSFASSIANKKVTVRAGINTYTDGTNIYIRPPISLAHKPTHDRSLCHKRGEDHQELCPGCRRIEELYTHLNHELGHIVFGSLSFSIDVRDWVDDIRNVCTEYVDQDYADWVIGKINRHSPKDAANFANSIHPTIGTGWNFVEDFRMENLVGKAHPGFVSMSWNTGEGILINGIDDGNGGTQRWTDMPPDNQIHAVWLFAAQNHEVEKYFDSRVTVPVREFISTYQRKLNNPMDSAIMSIVFYGFMKRRGFFSDGNNGHQSQPGGSDESTKQSAEQSGKQSGKQSGGTGSSCKSDEASLDADDQNSGGGKDSTQNEGGTSERNSGNNEHDNSSRYSNGTDDPESRESDSRSNGDSSAAGGDTTDTNQDGISDNSTGTSGEDSCDSVQETSSTGEITPHKCGIHRNENGTFEVGSSVPLGDDANADFNIDDRDLNIIIKQSQDYDEYCASIDALTYLNPLDARKDGTKLVDEPDMINLAPAMLHARRVFSDSKLDKHVRNLKTGKLDAGVLGRRAWNNDPRLFRKTLRAEGIDFEVCIGLDMSSSTNWNGAFKSIVEIGYYTAEMLNRIGVNFSLYGHKTGRGDNNGYLCQVLMPVKTINDPWGKIQKKKILSLTPGGGSLDGHNLEMYRKILQRSKAKKKLLIYFTDGRIPETNRSEEIPIVQREVKKLNQLGIAMLGVGLETDSPKEIGMDTIKVDGSSELTIVLKEIEKRINKVGI